MKNGALIELVSKSGHLKSDWWEWYCTMNTPDGQQISGTVQASGDGEMIAEETFEPDELLN